jgi:hypothetical protein
LAFEFRVTGVRMVFPGIKDKSRKPFSIERERLPAFQGEFNKMKEK